jgi:hypothetical protein
MTDSRRYFTLEEANAALPAVRAVVAEQMRRRGEIERELSELTRALGGAMPEVITAEASDAPDVARRKRVIAEKARAWEDGWAAVERLGALVKDPRIGLIDFFGRVEGRVVFLCWKWDEPEIAHYHELDEGFAGRKPLVGAVRARLYN